MHMFQNLRNFIKNAFYACGVVIVTLAVVLVVLAPTLIVLHFVCKYW